MANVSSWADIVQAVANPVDDNIELTLTKDIDLAEEPDYVLGITPLDIGGNALNINGNGHQIINLTNKLDTSGGIFISEAETAVEITINNIDFVNLMLNNAALIQGLNAADKLEVNNSRFEGKRYGNSYLFDILEAKFSCCFFDIPWIGTGLNPQKYTSLVTNPTTNTDTTKFTAQYCWFREHYTNWTVKSWSYSTVNSTTNSTLWTFYFIKLNGCYIDGDMTMSVAASTGHTTHIPIDLVYHPNRNSFTPASMSVFDVDVSCVGTRTVADYGSWYGLYVNKLRNENNALLTDWQLAYDTSRSASYPCPIIATEQQAQDDNWLHRMGFDI